MQQSVASTCEVVAQDIIAHESEAVSWAFTAFSIVGSVLHAVVYALLLVAIYAGRSKPQAAVPPSLNRP